MSVLKEYICILTETNRGYKDITFKPDAEDDPVLDQKEAIVDHLNSVYISELYLEKLLTTLPPENTSAHGAIQNKKILENIEQKSKIIKYLKIGFYFFLSILVAIVLVNIMGIYKNYNFFELSRIAPYGSFTFFCWVLAKYFIHIVNEDKNKIEKRMFPLGYNNTIETFTKNIIEDINAESEIKDSYNNTIPKQELNETKNEIINTILNEKDKYFKKDKFSVFVDVKEHITEELTNPKRLYKKQNLVDISGVKK